MSVACIGLRHASACYRMTAELTGFKAVTRDGLQLLVGQIMTVNLPMLRGDGDGDGHRHGRSAAPLTCRRRALAATSIRQQVQELPVAGRNWMGLALLAPGSRTSSTNATAPLPDRNGGEAREFQLNLDGQQISSELGTGNQPRFSQDSIAEFQFISNRFDATQGRSTGVQVNAITKSGTNRLSGLFRTNFRDSSFNAEDPVAEPRRADQRTSSTARRSAARSSRDKLHYFGNFEYEREPEDEHLEHAVSRRSTSS